MGSSKILCIYKKNWAVTKKYYDFLVNLIEKHVEISKKNVKHSVRGKKLLT